MLNKHFWLLSMLKTVVLHNIFVQTMMHFIFQDSQMKEQFFFNRNIVIINVFTGTFDQFNASSINKSINSLRISYWPQSSVVYF